MRHLRPFISVLVLVGLAALVTVPVAAQPAGDCSIPPGLAATLLYPYVEVDLGDVNGVTTVLSINNGLASDVLARAVLWSDWGVPTLAFDIYLDAFDVQTINMRSVFDGVIPSTGAGADLSDFAFCDSFPPDHSNPVLSTDAAAQLRADHTGTQGPVFFDCAGDFYGDSIARGYLTVDVVDECSGVESGDPFWTPASSDVYFGDGAVAINSNTLWGDYTFIDFTGAAAQGSQAVPVWASSATFPGPDVYTFYGRFHDYDGRDHRVPMPFRWDQRFLDGGVFGGGADLIVWRDPEVPTGPTTCGFRPAVFPLLDDSVALDEETNLFGLGDTNFPLATQRTPVSSLGIPADFGWIQVDSDNGSGNRSQAWVETTLSASAFGFSASWTGTPVSFLCNTAPSTN